MKKALPWVLIAGAALGCLALVDGSCHSNAALVKAKADYAELKRVTEADHAMSLGRIAALEASAAALAAQVEVKQAVIDVRDTTIAALRGKVSVTTAENERLRTEVQPALDANPALAEFVASLDAGIVLRNALIVEQDRQIVDLKEQGRIKDERFAVQLKLTDEWKAGYDREHALRIASEGLTATYAHRVRHDKFWVAVGKYAPPVAFAVGLLIKK